MATIPIGQPRYIDPIVVDIGDDIAVEHQATKGVTTTVRGIVAKREQHGQTRYYLTAEGGTLFSWEPRRKTRVRITLFGREETPQETLDMFDDVRKRSA